MLASFFFVGCMSVVCFFLKKKIAPNSKSRSRIILFLCEDARSIRMVTKAMLAIVGYVLCLEEGRGQRPSLPAAVDSIMY